MTRNPLDLAGPAQPAAPVRGLAGPAFAKVAPHVAGTGGDMMGDRGPMGQGTTDSSGRGMVGMDVQGVRLDALLARRTREGFVPRARVDMIRPARCTAPR